MSNISIGTYAAENVQKYTSLLPKNFNIVSVFGLSKVHEIFFPKEDNNIVQWKKLSTDKNYTTARLKIKCAIKPHLATNEIPRTMQRK